jgi:putative glutamine amidotransferase
MDGRPLIGITTYGRLVDGRYRLPAEYVAAVRRAGGIPMLVPPGEQHLEQLLAELDGLILSGGGDVDPRLYGGIPHATIERVDPERDAMEMEIARRVAERDLPTLCICRGAQVMNVALGGTLIEHLPDEVGEGVSHRPVDREQAYPRHPVAASAGSKLAGIMGETAVEPASWHHQAAREVARGLEVVAWADDGTVEAFEKPDHPWLVGVQWHPEMTAAEDETQQRLFDSLVEVATRRRRRRSDGDGR